MFCPQCGAPLAEGSKVCSACNHTLKYIPKPPEVLDPNIPVSKTKYFLKVASPDKKVLFFVALALGLLSVLSLVLSANRAVNGSIFKLPVVTLAGYMEGEDYSVMQDMIDEALETAEDDIEDLEEILEDMFGVSAEEVEDELGISTKKLIKLFKPFSLNSMVTIIDAFDMEQLDDDIRIIKVLVTVIKCVAFVYILLAVLGAVFQKTWLMVLTYILSFGFVLSAGGIFLWVLASASFISAAVFFSKLKSEYKVYLAGFGIS